MMKNYGTSKADVGTELGVLGSDKGNDEKP
jgi:hypothetical protein